MRRELKKENGVRTSFIGVVERFGRPKTRKTPTIMLSQVVFSKDGREATDHVWFMKGRTWRHVKIGDIVTFDARVKEYEKGWRGRKPKPGAPPPSSDYRLSHPTKIIVKKDEAT